MTYSLTVVRANSNQLGNCTYVNGLTQWSQVTHYLRNKLDQYVVKVYIYKYSSDNRVLGQKCVTMANLCEVAFALRDKQVLI